MFENVDQFEQPNVFATISGAGLTSGLPLFFCVLCENPLIIESLSPLKNVSKNQD